MTDNLKTLSAYEIYTLEGKRERIRAMKLYMERTGAFASQARAAVEAYGDANGLREDGPCVHCRGSGRGRSWKS